MKFIAIIALLTLSGCAGDTETDVLENRIRTLEVIVAAHMEANHTLEEQVATMNEAIRVLGEERGVE
jgi:outer membrane murein-binding lipoprotein Lpp